MKGHWQEGTISLFAVIVLLPLIALVMLSAQVGSRALYRIELKHRLRAHTMSLAAGFDADLLEDYGIFAVTEEIKDSRYAEDNSLIVTLSDSLDNVDVLGRAVLAEGENLFGIVAMDRVLSKIQLLSSYAAEATDVLNVVEDQASEVAGQTVSAILGQNLPEIDLAELAEGVMEMIRALGDNWSLVDWTWLWGGDNRQLNIGGILGESRAFFAQLQQWNPSEEIRLRVAYSAYAMSYLSAYDNPVDREAVLPTSEAEYCVFGRSIGSVNLMECFSEIYKMRLAVNLVDYLVTLEIPEPTTLLICASVLAIIAATTDVVSLMAGNTTPISPHIEVVEVDYRDYLAIMLLMESPQMLLERIRSIICINLDNQGKTPLNECFNAISVSCDQGEYYYAYR